MLSRLLFGCPPKLDGKILLWKTTYSLVTGYRKVRLILTWKHPFCCLAFIVLEGVVHTARG